MKEACYAGCFFPFCSLFLSFFNNISPLFFLLFQWAELLTSNSMVVNELVFSKPNFFRQIFVNDCYSDFMKIRQTVQLLILGTTKQTDGQTEECVVSPRHFVKKAYEQNS